MEAQPHPLSSRLPRRAVGPERTQISYQAALTPATYAAFLKESRMKFTNATEFNRKSGGAQRRDLQFAEPLVDVLHQHSFKWAKQNR